MRDGDALSKAIAWLGLILAWSDRFRADEILSLVFSDVAGRRGTRDKISSLIAGRSLTRFLSLKPRFIGKEEILLRPM